MSKTLPNNRLSEEIVSSQKDMVNHPQHYTKGKIEVIEVIEDARMGTDFCLGNVIKYVLRASHKGSMYEDLKNPHRRNSIMEAAKGQDVFLHIEQKGNRLLEEKNKRKKSETEHFEVNCLDQRGD